MEFIIGMLITGTRHIAVAKTLAPVMNTHTPARVPEEAWKVALGRSHYHAYAY